LCMYQRSGDVGLGVPFNILSYSFLTHLLAFHCSLKAKEFIHVIGDAHIYPDHEKELLTQSYRAPFKCPKIQFTSDKKNEFKDYDISDISIIDYKYHPKIEMNMTI
jgi:thymidylate synthase